MNRNLALRVLRFHFHFGVVEKLFHLPFGFQRGPPGVIDGLITRLDILADNWGELRKVVVDLSARITGGGRCHLARTWFVRLLMLPSSLKHTALA
jgi:hypothetical protein